jgi:RNA polymerase sigma-70 factor (ECF subfamily)
LKTPQPDAPSQEESDLLRQALRLDEAGLGAVFDQCYRPLYLYLYAHLGHAATAEDLTAEVFRIFIEQVSRGRGPTRRLKAWLYRVAHNLMVDELRRRRYSEHDLLPEDLPDGDPAPADQVQRNEERQALRLALRRLPAKQQVVLTMKYFQGMDNDRIARALQLKQGAVRALQFRGLRALARTLKKTPAPRREENGMEKVEKVDKE